MTGGARIQEIEIQDFKSYRGYQRLNLGTSNFISVIGPNGAGKSNLMDAISFVLGVHASDLRSQNLTHLVYHGRDRSEHGQTQQTSAFVCLGYVSRDRVEIKFKRSIKENGSSEYRIDDKVTPVHVYSKVLASHDIYTSAKNFLVFQGDVEHVATQTPQERSDFLERICGSFILRQEYQLLKEESDQAASRASVAVAARRAAAAEVNQLMQESELMREQQRKIRQRDDLRVVCVLGQLYHVDCAISRAQESHVQLQQTRIEKDAARDAARVELDKQVAQHAQATLELRKVQTAVRQCDVRLNAARMQLVPLDERLRLLAESQGLKKQRQAEITVDLHSCERVLAQFVRDRAVVERARDAFEANVTTTTDNAVHVTPEQMREYEELRQTFHGECAMEPAARDRLMRKQTALQEQLDSMQAQREARLAHVQRLQDEIGTLQMKKKMAADRVDHEASVLRDRQTAVRALRQSLDDAARLKRESDEKLQKVTKEILELYNGRRDALRTQAVQTAVAKLRQLVPRNCLFGFVHELCEPVEQQYSVAVATALGHHLDSVVVDSVRTAETCVRHLRQQRAARATFMPLESIVASDRVPTHLRGAHRHARLALDTVRVRDPRVSRAVEFACGNWIICDDVATAHELLWGGGHARRGPINLVCLDGTVLRSSGIVSGGSVDHATDRHTVTWQEQRVAKLERAKDALVATIAAKAAYVSQRASDIADLDAQINDTCASLETLKARLSSVTNALADRTAELGHVQNELDAGLSEFDALRARVARGRDRVAEVERALDAVAARVYAGFCERVHVASIKEFEAVHGLVYEERSRLRVEFAGQLSQLDAQIELHDRRVAQARERVRALQQSLAQDLDARAQLELDTATVRDRVAGLASELDQLQRERDALAETGAAAAERVGAARHVYSRVCAEYETVLSQCQTVAQELAQLRQRRTNLLRDSMYDGVEVPLSRGSHVDMHVDDASEDIAVDYSGLADKYKRQFSDEHADHVAQQIRELNSEIEQRAVSVRTPARLAQAQEVLARAEQAVGHVRADARTVRDKFARVRAQRVDLFRTAFSSVQSCIDDVYKALTRTAVHPLGGHATLSVDDDVECYNGGVQYSACPPGKRYTDMGLLSGGEKTIAALAFVFALQRYRACPFFVLDEIDAALDNANVASVARYIAQQAREGRAQFIVISLKQAFYETSSALIGVYRDQAQDSSATLGFDLSGFPGGGGGGGDSNLGDRR